MSIQIPPHKDMEARPSPASLTSVGVPQRPIRFLHRVEAERRLLRFVQTDLGRLQQAIFLDGRERFWDRDEAVALLGPSSARSEAVNDERYIFHMAFGGSTLLSRILGESGAALVLKEPHCLVDLADWRRSLGGDPRPSEFEEGMLRARSELFGLPGPVVVKPSNWANNLVPSLCDSSSRTRAIFLVIERREFVRAVIRGGRERLAFAARAASHLAGAFQNGEELMRAAVASGADPLEQMGNFASLLHSFQLSLFETAASPEGLRRRSIDFAEIRTDPAAAACRAAGLLSLSPDQTEIHSVTTRIAGRHAKAIGTEYSDAASLAADRAVDEAHGALIDRCVRRADQWRPVPTEGM